MGKKKAKQVTKKVEVILFKGPTRSFRLRNPPGHADKYEWTTLKEGMVVPKEFVPLVKEEQKKVQIEKRIEELAEDLKDDGKRNFSKNKDKKAPGRRKSKSKKK